MVYFFFKLPVLSGWVNKSRFSAFCRPCDSLPAAGRAFFTIVTFKLHKSFHLTRPNPQTVTCLALKGVSFLHFYFITVCFTVLLCYEVVFDDVCSVCFMSGKFLTDGMRQNVRFVSHCRMFFYNTYIWGHSLYLSLVVLKHYIIIVIIIITTTS